MSRGAPKFMIYNLRETYHELGEYDFRVVLDAKFFNNSHGSSVSIVNPDGTEIPCNVERWGRKMRCQFRIGESVPDGVSIIKLSLRDSRDREQKHSVKFWVIKP